MSYVENIMITFHYASCITPLDGNICLFSGSLHGDIVIAHVIMMLAKPGRQPHEAVSSHLQGTINAACEVLIIILLDNGVRKPCIHQVTI